MTRITRAFLIKDGKESALAKLVARMDRSTEEVRKFYQRYGVLREVWDLQPSSEGMIVIVCTEIQDESLLEKFAQSQGEFEVWFKAQVLDLTGVDLNEMGNGHPSEELFRWEAYSMESGGYS